MKLWSIDVETAGVNKCTKAGEEERKKKEGYEKKKKEGRKEGHKV